jgi:hypothetical protein
MSIWTGVTLPNGRIVMRNLSRRTQSILSGVPRVQWLYTLPAACSRGTPDRMLLN